MVAPLDRYTFYLFVHFLEKGLHWALRFTLRVVDKVFTLMLSIGRKHRGIIQRGTDPTPKEFIGVLVQLFKNVLKSTPMGQTATQEPQSTHRPAMWKILMIWNTCVSEASSPMPTH